ncbi:ATP-binding protein [Nocardioides sp.]|uniref:sensor histidine kinase n=1 Tax=Nocardioides sp. TaxID=35761 RepID=UPI0039E56EAB
MTDPLDTLPDGVVLAGADGTVTVANAAARSMLGVADPVGAPLADVLLLQDTDGQGWTVLNRPYAGLRTRTGIPEQSWLLPDGTEVLTHARILREPRGGPVTGVAITIRSGRGRERLDRERSDLVATLAHELRSPLTGVKGFVQALLNRWDRLNDEQKKLMLTTAHVDADRLSRLIGELLDVARLDTGRLQLHPRPSDLRVLAERVVASVSHSTSRPVVLEAAEDLPAVTVDPDKVTQVVTNLVENGVRHGEGTVTVRLTASADHVSLSVEDEGDGIPPELRRRVFTKFWKGGGTGSGLGLYLVGGLVKAHGGTVTIGESAAGGARVETTWPVEADSPAS